MKGKANRGRQQNRRGRGQRPNYSNQQSHTPYEEMFESINRHGNVIEPDNIPPNGSQSHNPHRGEYRPNAYQQKMNEEFQDRQKKQGGSSHQYQQDTMQENSSKKEQSGSGTYTNSSSDKQMASQFEHQRHSRKDRESPNSGKVLLVCGNCSSEFDDKTKTPRALPCGHTFCTLCLRELIDSEIGKRKCYKCGKPLKDVKNVENIKTNYSVFGMVKINVTSKERPEHKSAESISCRPKHDGNRPVVTPSSSQSAKKSSSSGNEPKMDWSATDRSPHNSRCLEVGIYPTSHCARCQKWVCDKCGTIDHDPQNSCYLIPKKEALSHMTQAQVNGAKGVCDTVENTLLEWKMYVECLDAFALAMQTAFESVGKEKERVKAMTEEGQKKNNKLDAVVASLPDAKNLPDALAGLQEVEGICDRTRVWMTENLAKTFDLGSLNKVTKEILLSSIYMQGMAGNKSKTTTLLYAQHTLSGVTYMSCMTRDGGRIFVHALERRPTVDMGSRAMPLTSILSCLNPCSTLTFLDIGWEGQVKGRIYIRLLGDTQRGRQFVTLCTGKVGPSLLGTRFHRVWWRDLPGEHLWGGDYDKGDGSGGASVLQLSDKEMSSLLPGRCLPITAGLVAGRYEKTRPSSIFRIYTRDCKKGNETTSYLSRSPAEVKDEAAFGTVEYGLDVLKGVVKRRDLKDVTILDCGVVVET